MDKTFVKEVMTLDCIGADGREVQKKLTAAQLVELVRTGGASGNRCAMTTASRWSCCVASCRRCVR